MYLISDVRDRAEFLKILSNYNHEDICTNIARLINKHSVDLMVYRKS
jgi:hypothetical protein